MFDNWGYENPGNMPEPFDPFEADEYILWLIESGQAPKVEELA